MGTWSTMKGVCYIRKKSKISLQEVLDGCYSENYFNIEYSDTYKQDSNFYEIKFNACIETEGHDAWAVWNKFINSVKEIDSKATFRCTVEIAVW